MTLYTYLCCVTNATFKPFGLFMTIVNGGIAWLYPSSRTKSLQSNSSVLSLQWLIWSHLLLMLIHCPSPQVNSSPAHPDSFIVILYGLPLLHSKIFNFGLAKRRFRMFCLIKIQV